MLSRLIYASQATVAMTPVAVRQLLEQSRRNNARLHLSGLLAHDQRSFLQVLEGPRETVSEVYTRIANDTRHTRVLLMEMAAIDERGFYDWSMGFADAGPEYRSLYLRHGPSSEFDPHRLSAASALGLLRALAHWTPSAEGQG